VKIYLRIEIHPVLRYYFQDTLLASKCGCFCAKVGYSDERVSMSEKLQRLIDHIRESKVIDVMLDNSLEYGLYLTRLMVACENVVDEFSSVESESIQRLKGILEED
jgi:hypothetical protein